MLKKTCAILFIIFLCGCATVYNPATERKEFIFINDAAEVDIGRYVVTQVTSGQRLLKDTRLESRVTGIGSRIAAVSDRANIGYEFHILENRELNAISLPGGFIYINNGLLNKLDDNELAFVLGHEVGHVAARHAVKKIQSNLAFQVILAVAFAAAGDKSGQGAGTINAVADAGSQIYNLISLGYSRQDEYLADKLGAKYAFQAGFDPYAGISALEKIREGEGAGLKMPEYLRTHPYAPERIKVLEEIIPQVTNTRY